MNTVICIYCRKKVSRRASRQLIRGVLSDARGYAIASGGRDHPWGRRVLDAIDGVIGQRQEGGAA